MRGADRMIVTTDNEFHLGVTEGVKTSAKNGQTTIKRGVLSVATLQANHNFSSQKCG